MRCIPYVITDQKVPPIPWPLLAGEDETRESTTFGRLDLARTGKR
jgi:hypothetical protein